jgi:hypothetical protein
MRPLAIALTDAVGCLAAAFPVQAAPRDLDPAYGDRGTETTATNAGGDYDFAVGRYLP